MPHPATLQPGALPGSLPSQSMPPNMVPAQLRMGHPGGAPPAPSPYMQPQFMQGGRPPPMHNGGRMPMPMGPTAGQQQMSQQVPPQPGQPAPQGSGQPPPGQQQQQQPMMQPGQPQIMQQPKVRLDKLALRQSLLIQIDGEDAAAASELRCPLALSHENTT